MTVDREGVKRIAQKYRDGKWQGMGTELLVGLDAALIALDAADRRIAELEKQNERFVAIVSACDEHGDVWRTVDALAAARTRIAELEAGLSEALGSLEDVARALAEAPVDSEDDENIRADLSRLRSLLPSEET